MSIKIFFAVLWSNRMEEINELKVVISAPKGEVNELKGGIRTKRRSKRTKRGCIRTKRRSKRTKKGCIRTKGKSTSSIIQTKNQQKRIRLCWLYL